MEKKNKKLIFSKELILGIIIGALIMFAVLYFVNNNGVAIKVGGKTITEDELFATMKNYFSVGLIMDEIDKIILPQEYTLTEDMKKEVEEEANYYIEMYEAYYGYTEEEFLEENGFSTKEEFTDYLGLDYRRNLYYYDYLESKLEDGAVQAYYDANKADVDKAENEHILVSLDEEATDEEEKEALALANEIIQKLNEGTSFADVAAEYGDKVTYQELGFIGKNDSLVQEYLDALFALGDGKYSAEPVKTEYGYHIIYRTATSTVEDVRTDIIDILSEDMVSENENIYETALMELREKYNLDIKDKTLKEKYEAYKQGLTETEE